MVVLSRELTERILAEPLDEPMQASDENSPSVMEPMSPSDTGDGKFDDANNAEF